MPVRPIQEKNVRGSIFFTAEMIILGFFMLFAAPRDWFTGTRHWLGGYGILVMVLGPIVIRLVYELLMIAVLLLKNVISINNKLRSQNGDGQKENVFGAPDMSELRQQIQTKTAPAPGLKLPRDSA